MSTDPATTRLLQAGVFSKLSDDVRDRLESLARIETFEAGDTIIERGESGTALYVLRAGSAYATVPGADGTLFDDDMEPGAVFGEMALLTGEPRSARVWTDTGCECAIIEFDDLRKVFETHPRVAQLLTTLVGTRLRKRDAIKAVGDYEIIRPLGRGGFSTVFRAKHKDTGELVALKMLKHELMWRADFAKRFRSEERIIQTLVHPNIVRVFGVIEAYATLFLVMELVEGSDLGQLIAARGKLPPSEVRYIARRLCSALEHAHSRSVIHRDIKPANILMTAEGDVKLLDFGIALGPDDGTADHSFYGTPHYAAPEHVMNLRIDGRSDLYMLGMTVYELLTGDVPYADDTVRTTLQQHVRNETPSLPDEVPGDLRRFVSFATRRRPRQRFANCAEAAACLSEVTQDEFLRGPTQPDWSSLSLRPTQAAHGVHEMSEASASTLTAALTPLPFDSSHHLGSHDEFSVDSGPTGEMPSPRKMQRVDLTLAAVDQWTEESALADAEAFDAPED